MLLREWAARMYPGIRLIEQMRLGPTTSHLAGVALTPALEAALRVSNWYADGVLNTPDGTIIIESKMDPNPSAVGQVNFYLRLLPSTPQMAPWLHLPIRAAVLFAKEDYAVSNFARSNNVQALTYTPPWYPDYITQRYGRKGAPGSSGAPAASEEIQSTASDQESPPEGT